MWRIPPWYATALHALSIVAVPVCILAVGAWEHPFLVIMLMPVAALMLVLHAVATFSSVRGMRDRDEAPTARIVSLAVAAAVPVASVLAWSRLDHFAAAWWAIFLLLALLHVVIAAGFDTTARAHAT